MTRFSITVALVAAVVLLVLFVGPEVHDSRLATTVALLTPLGTATAVAFRRWFTGLLDPAHLTSAGLTACSILATCASLFELSGRLTTTAAFLSLTTGALAGTLLRRTVLAKSPTWTLSALALGALLGFGAFAVFGSGAIVVLAVGLTLYSATSITLNAALNDEETPAAARELALAH